MKIMLSGAAATLLRILLAPIVLPVRAFRALTGGAKPPVYVSTIDGDPLAYAGDHPILIAVWASWASVWKAATEQVVEQLKTEFAGQCEIAYVEGTNRSIAERYSAEVLPVLIVRHRGQEVARFVNTMAADEVRRAILECAR